MEEKKKYAKKREEELKTSDLTVRLREQEKKHSASVTGPGETSVTGVEPPLSAGKSQRSQSHDFG